MRRYILVVSLLVAAALALPAAAQSGDSSANPFHWSGQMSAGQVLSVHDINGDIHALPASGNTAEVTAEKSGSDADQLQIRVQNTGEGVKICVIYPSDNGRENTCEHSHSDRNIHARVDFTVRVPSTVQLHAHDVNGSVEARDLGSNAEVSSVNGSVEVSTAGWAEAKSVNGSVRVTMGRADWPDELRLESVNGEVEAEVPGELNSDVEFNTLNGNVKSDFPYTVGAGTSIGSPGRGTNIRATIGAGGRTLVMKSVNGSLVLRRR